MAKPATRSNVIARLYLLIDEQPSHALSSPDAHAGQKHLRLSPPALAQTSDDLPCTGGTYRVCVSESTAVWPHFARMTYQVDDPKQWHRLGHSVETGVSWLSIRVRVEQ